MKFSDFDFNFEREALIRPFSFKGSAFTEKWINIVALKSAAGLCEVGIGSTAVLWSDPAFFSANTETGGNLVISRLCEEAARLILDKEYRDPVEAVKSIVDPLHEIGKRISGTPGLRKTFVLNSMIALDNAMWKLFFTENHGSTFGDIIPESCRDVLRTKHEELACLPLITYNVPVGEVVEAVRNGTFFLKIKIGQPGTQEEMLKKDCARLSDLFDAVNEYTTPYTDCGKVVFYLDANGRYGEIGQLRKLIDHLADIGMLDRVLILEEPFPEDYKEDVSSLPLRVAADESLHGVEDIRERAELGYRAFALKPAGKTLSMCFEMAAEAHQRELPCFVADSACVPQLVDWNKNFAARLPLFPGLKIGFMESNGSSFYKRWRELLADHPCSGAQWLEPVHGLFKLDADFYARSGGIFHSPGHYAELMN